SLIQTCMKIVFIISASIAAYKSAELVRILKQQNHAVTCVLTKSAKNFVTKTTLETLSENKVYDDLFHEAEAREMQHINLSRDHDIILICPASADIIAKIAHGIADNMATNVILAANKPIYIAPAMNVMMWDNPITQENIEKLAKYPNINIIEPDAGELACKEIGYGRLANFEKIIHAISAEASNAISQELLGKKVMITAGPTIEAIDPVRFITNHSSGKQGYAIAQALANRGADVTLISGPVNIKAPNNVKLINVSNAAEMHEESLKNLPCDIAICTAAVTDWRVQNYSHNKIKKSDNIDALKLELFENTDILQEISIHANRPDLVIGFAAETENIIENGAKKLDSKKCDWIVANNVADDSIGFQSDYNQVTLLAKDFTEKWDKITKQQVAERLVDKIINVLCG
ncbi:MAG: bifunctional phosphopantothenoylcysteine decarboxylase/phosphopantothenate--cysteine ligase CoaBC, partial [Pseudomonadota bacterium]